MVFDRKIYGKPVSFMISGLLYQSDVSLDDDRSDSLWSQLKRGRLPVRSPKRTYAGFPRVRPRKENAK